MLSDRDRRILARIERHLTDTDPDLVRLFATAGSHAPDSSGPTVLLVTGLLLLVFGSLVAAIPVALAGMALAVFALFTAYARPARLGRPRLA